MTENFSLKYEKELLESVIPFWEKHCIDGKYGGYFNFLDRDGSVYDTDKFMWMQWRIVYMFAILDLRSLTPKNALDLVYVQYIAKVSYLKKITSIKSK